MGDRYLLESGSPDGYLLEDGTGVLLLNNDVAWSATASDTGYTISSDGLTATMAGAGGGPQAQANSVKSSGYFEIVSTNCAVGLTPSGAANTTWIGFVANSIGYHQTGTVYRNNVNFATYATFTAGDVVMVALKGGFVYFGKNGVWQSGTDPSAGTGGIDVSALFASAVPAASANSATDNAVGRWTASALTYALPTGLTAWDGTVKLTGQSVTASLGSVTATTAPALTGASVSIAQGTVLQGAPLTGQSLTAAQGSVTQSVTVALTGQSVSVARGTVVPAPSLAITGQSLSLSQGSIVASPGVALLGQAVSVSRGSVLAAASPALTGNAATTAQGSLTDALSTALTGQGLTAAQGTVVVGASDVTAALAGQAVASSLGSLSPSLSVAGSGQSSTASSGTVIGAPSTALAGQFVGVAQDAFMLASSTVLTGKEIGVGQFALLLAETMNEPKFWNPPPLTGRRMSVSRSR